MRCEKQQAMGCVSDCLTITEDSMSKVDVTSIDAH